MVKEGSKAADFALQGIDENGETRQFSLKGLRGRKVVLYFYPKDETPGCAQEACDFRDNMARVRGALVLGVSPDGLDSHRKFREKHGLGYPLLSDEGARVAAAYGAWGEKSVYGKKSIGIIRSTFLIDEQGVVKKAWTGVKVAGHVDEVIEALG